MAEFQEVIKEWERMCNTTQCLKCGFYKAVGANVDRCKQFIADHPTKAEEIIMAWSAEHPEPVYPTWYEFLGDIYPASWDLIANKRVPADIAQKLGLEPKEEER